MKITNTKFTDFNLASEDTRIENFYIDFILSSLIAAPIATYFYIETDSILYFIVLFYSFRWLYYMIFEMTCGRTPGKFETRSIVVDAKKQRPHFLRLAIRNWSRFYSVLSAVSDDEIALHDKHSKTFVIEDKSLKKINFKKIVFLLFLVAKALFWAAMLKLKNATSIFYISMLLLTLFLVIYTLKLLLSKRNKI
ncbi:RDD family protein [Cellulophaga sp. 20_2_10]|uniref:RDD family protein n=1 Tax=Cellulophaga sp. 20_2_10 TaxID=2942476 RepID=UPI00201A28C6|nr:RDD family protein [Cellulophaga sp. 20_2_10]MCL5246556.1 RDD family protein [Cellulophaga sp. 20_2_10]